MTEKIIGRIKLTNVRLSFPCLFKAEAYQPGDAPMFKATFLVPKDDPQVKAIEAAILDVATAKYGAKAKAFVDSIRANSNKFCWQDGDTKTYAGYEGMMALGAKSATRPTVVDKDRSPLDSADGKPYAGCYVNAFVTFFHYTTGGKGISASLEGVQFTRDGDAFTGGRPARADEFEDVSEGADAEDFA